MASKSKIIAELFEADGDIIASALDNVVVTPTAVSDQANTSTGGLSMPTGTTAQRPSSPDTGESRMNTTTGSLEFYDGSGWVSTNLIPLINSVTGNIVNDTATQLVFSLSNNTDSVDIVFSEGGSAFHTMSGQSVSSGAITITVPSQVYGQTVGDTIIISVNNADGTPSSNTITKTVLALPTGGTITTSGNIRTHAFTSSSNFVVPTGVSVTAEAFIYQKIIYEVGKEIYPDNLRGWFISLYQILFGSDSGPRLGSFFKVFGKEKVLILLKSSIN